MDARCRRVAAFPGVEARHELEGKSFGCHPSAQADRVRVLPRSRSRLAFRVAALISSLRERGRQPDLLREEVRPVPPSCEQPGGPEGGRFVTRS
ncbi:hypothetical protein CLOM_g2064 [Closterium sp. NIES-68]|nr:hypothetical protein CLOM_g2064 [Closterium sp. NIES-68]